MSEEFICKVAGTAEEAKTLIEAGFSYVCEFQTVQEEKVKCRWLIPKQH